MNFFCFISFHTVLFNNAGKIAKIEDSKHPEMYFIVFCNVTEGI